MDTLIGTYSLTDNQIANLSTIVISQFKGLSYQHDSGNVIAVSENIPTQIQIDLLSNSILSLPDVLDKKIAQQIFNGDAAKKQLYQTLGASIGQLAPYWGVLSDMITFKNFDGIKLYSDGLITAGVLSSGQYQAINSIFKSQNVDLDNL